MANLSTLQTPFEDPISSLYKDKSTPAPTPEAEPVRMDDVYSKLGLSDQTPAQPQFKPMPLPDVKKRVEEQLKFTEPYRKDVLAKEQQLGQFEAEQKLAELEQQRIKAQGEREAYTQYAEDMKRTELRQRREKLQQEIDKCVILCSNCHRLVHSNLITLI